MGWGLYIPCFGPCLLVAEFSPQDIEHSLLLRWCFFRSWQNVLSLAGRSQG